MLTASNILTFKFTLETLTFNLKTLYISFVVRLPLRRAKDHERFAQFAANVYETVSGLTLLSSLYVVSTEAYTDICLKAVQGDYAVPGEDREKKESQSVIEKRCVFNCDRVATDQRYYRAIKLCVIKRACRISD